MRVGRSKNRHRESGASGCIPIAAKHQKLDDQQRNESARFYTYAALKLLRDAVSNGYNDVAHMKKDIDLDPCGSGTIFKSSSRNWKGRGSSLRPPHARSLGRRRHRRLHAYREDTIVKPNRALYLTGPAEVATRGIEAASAPVPGTINSLLTHLVRI
jgi:hypothetical protein